MLAPAVQYESTTGGSVWYQSSPPLGTGQAVVAIDPPTVAKWV